MTVSHPVDEVDGVTDLEVYQLGEEEKLEPGHEIEASLIFRS